MHLDTVTANDSGRLLPAVLKAVQPQVCVPRRIGVPSDAENTTLVSESI